MSQTKQPTLSPAPLDVYVMDISYFSGKFEAYLRYKEIHYHRILVDHPRLFDVYKQTGTMIVPAVRTPEGLWLKDTTPMMAWFEERHPSLRSTAGWIETSRFLLLQGPQLPCSTAFLSGHLAHHATIQSGERPQKTRPKAFSQGKEKPCTSLSICLNQMFFTR